MEVQNHLFPWLELTDHPTFCVKDGIIIATNAPAEQRTLRVGTDIREIVTENRESYDSFVSGSLYLHITVCGLPCLASVTRTQECDIFQIHRDSDRDALQALSLAAMQLRMPLANVMAVTDRMFGDLDQADDKIQKQAGQIIQNLYRLLRIISNMSDAGSYLNPSSAGMDTVDLSARIDEVIEKVQALFADIGIRLVYTGLKAPVFGLANTEKLQRAIYNLLSNAMKYSQAGSTINARLTKNGNQLSFTVCNTTGKNLTDSGLWQRYRREPTIEDPRHGLGLGMTLVSAVAALHKGTVLVDHPTDGETRVTMTIPIIKDTTSSAVRSPVLHIGDYAGGRDIGLLELSDILPSDAYKNIN